MADHVTRRSLVGASALAALGIGFKRQESDKPAILGGAPVKKGGFPGWPEVKENDERGWMNVLRSRRWFRLEGDSVRKFEAAWAEKLGAKYCLATTSGTTALVTALRALGIGPGDEVIVPPYTFIATVNAVLLQHALPIFADSDLETFQLDPRKAESAITSETACLLPVHIGGAAADMDAFIALGRKRNLPVLEDACQAHLGEWRGKKLSAVGDIGCFSFQASKNLNSGEGGAVITSRPDLLEKAWAFHNQGFPAAGATHVVPACGANLRMTEFQGALLLEQMTRVDEQSRIREQNAAYLTRMLSEIPGISPARMYEGCTRNAYHLYMFRYDSSKFAGVPRARFLEALRAEGVPASGGYSPLNKQAFLKNTFASKGFQKIYGSRKLRDWEDRNQCPVNDRLCQEAVWFSQTMLLGPRSDMDLIAEAIRKLHRHAASVRA
jgi:dTDP-4-amino-4,6-dideoxygalactose transaminase